jgi:hypothetical protein
MANETTYFISSNSNFSYEEATVGYFTGTAVVGSHGSNAVKAAFRFLNIPLAQNTVVNEAVLLFKAQFQGSGSGNLKFKTYGIKETNTADLTSNPFSRTHTTAFDSADNPLPGTGNYKSITVTSIVNEILAQGGWASGNAMGFFCENDGSNSNVYIEDDDGTSYLAIRVNAEPTFFPTPKSQSAPTFPASTDYGIKISQPGTDVNIATEEQTYFTTRKKVFKTFLEGSVAVVAGVEKLITHNLGYPPFVLAYARANGLSLKAPRLFFGVDPIGSDLQVWTSVDNTYLKLSTTVNADVYYYIFLDEQLL